MLKETGYQEKFAMLKPYLESIIQVVKKDLKTEHWKKDRSFCNKYFFGKNPAQVPLKTMAEAYAKEIEAGNVGLGEFIASRWLLKNTDIYGYFEERLTPISKDFDTLDEIPISEGRPICEGAVAAYGWKLTYLFCVLNSVVFPKELYAELQKNAREEAQVEQKKGKEQEELRTLESLKKRHVRELSALTEKYEKKITGMQKKYLKDTEGLKTEIERLKLAHGGG